MKALKDELKIDKPRTCVLQELMELTFCHRREFVLNYATSVDEILMTYPSLHQPDIVSTLILSKIYVCIHEYMEVGVLKVDNAISLQPEVGKLKLRMGNPKISPY